jgi:tannase
MLLLGGPTIAGYNAFDYSYNDVILYGNGSINWDATYMFAYRGFTEVTIVGKAITAGFDGFSSDTKIYTYYEGCSDGGREGHESGPALGRGVRRCDRCCSRT